MRTTPQRTDQPTITRNGRPRRWVAASLAAVLTGSFVLLAPPAAADDGQDGQHGTGGTVISDVNGMAASTLANNFKAGTEQVLYMSFVQAAVYDAVVGIEGGYQPYRFHARAPRGASSAAAAIAAARKVLVTYASASLDNSFDQALALIPDSRSKTDGVAYGELAAQNLIDLRAHDGRNAPVLFTTPPAPGVWRPQAVTPPTPPSTADFLTPWLGAVTPLMIRSGAQFGEPGPPPALTSARYTRDFNEVKSLGAVNSTTRTPEQTATALFFSGSAFVQTNAALRNQVDVRNLDIVHAARLFAAVDMTVADALISVWHAKYLYGFWRPVTAIQLAGTDGNPLTTADPTWQPLLATPPYPDYVSGYTGIICSFVEALKETVNTRHLQLSLISTAVPGAERTYDSGRTLCGDVQQARIWLGIHFRTADTEAAKMGQRVADFTLDRNFEPVREDRHGDH
jgi:hypothetical protein